jgi:peptidoglycan-associated lipoprotein
MKTISYCIRGLVTWIFFVFFFSTSASANENYQYSQWTTGLGAGVLFYEMDEEFNSSFMLEAKAGYDINERFTFEGSFGYLPYMASRSHTKNNPRTWHLDKSQGFRAAVDLLYHLNSDSNRKWDPTLGITGGSMYYSNTLESGDHFDAFGGIGAGISRALGRNWLVRGDYRLLVAGHDTEINHHTLISLGYRWGAKETRTSVGTGKMVGDDDIARIPGLRTIHFEFDRSRLTPESKARLEGNAKYLRENPKLKVILEGHCDERGTREYNYALGERRAHSAKEYLRTLGVPANQMETISYGKDRPAINESNEAAWAKNRRVEFVPKK